VGDEYELSDLDDAIVEDTCHCGICGARFTLGGNDYVILDGSETHFRPEFNGGLCIGCAEAVHKAYLEALREMCVCEHGLSDGEYCPDCNRAYKEAARRHGGT
jgi:hypothetical protein